MQTSTVEGMVTDLNTGDQTYTKRMQKDRSEDMPLDMDPVLDKTRNHASMSRTTE